MDKTQEFLKQLGIVPPPDYSRPSKVKAEKGSPFYPRTKSIPVICPFCGVNMAKTSLPTANHSIKSMVSSKPIVYKCSKCGFKGENW